jgi:chaperonin cofactor prefoldin
MAAIPYPVEADYNRLYTSRAVTDKLVAEKKQLERRLRDINRALDALANNPEVQIALDAISRLGHL